MRKSIGLVLACLLLAVGAVGSPLVFKSTKEIKTNDLAELATFLTGDYVKIRIALKGKNSSDSTTRIEFYSVEDGSEVLIESKTAKEFNESFIMDVPPAKMRVKIQGSGNYSIFVWGA